MTAAFDFDRVIDRRSTDSNKWRKFGPDVLPLWVADMDFPSPPAVVAALQAPVGRVYSRSELEGMAAACLKRDLWIVADEIHCDLLLDGRTHVPMASLSPEIEQRTLTFMAPSKTFNLPGLKCAVAIVPNAKLR